MPRKSLEERMDSVERRVEILERLPERVAALESQIVLLRDEMRSEFSATHARVDEVQRVLREEIRTGDEETRRVLREDIRAGDEETRRVLTERIEFLFDANERHMRLLHEDLVQRIVTLNEGRS